MFKLPEGWDGFSLSKEWNQMMEMERAFLVQVMISKDRKGIQLILDTGTDERFQVTIKDMRHQTDNVQIEKIED